MIYDCFIFFNELELLEIRLNTLENVVDKFVIVESTISFSGLSKKLFYDENKKLFKKYAHKIIHHIVDDTPKSYEELQFRFSNASTTIDKQKYLNCLTTTNVPYGQFHWMREFYQKECMKDALINAGIADDDVCYISDLDEIWNPNISYVIDDNQIYKCKQLVFSMYLNMRSSEEWAGTYYTKFKNVKNASVNHLDTPNKTTYTYIDNAGWHFSYQGGVDRIKTKIENFGHQEYNNDYIKNNISNSLESNTDILGRNEFKYWIDNVNLPEYIKINKNKFKHLLK